MDSTGISIQRSSGRDAQRRRHHRWIGAAIAVAVVTLLLAGNWGGFASAVGLDRPTGSSAVLTVTPNYPTPIRHVFVIIMENVENTYALRYLAFERYLAQNFSYASNYYALCHPSAANYVAINSGNVFTQCGSDTLHAGAYNTVNIGDLADAAGETWMSFIESMPKPCDPTNTSVYASGANPFLDFKDIWNNKTRCDAHDVSFTNWYADVNASGTDPSAIPNYAFFVPNLLDDGHNENHNYSDAWLASFVYTWFLSQAFMSDSVLFIVYDEGTLNSGYTTDGVTMKGGAVPLFVISPYSIGGVDTSENKTYTNDSSQYSLLSTTEWLLGLGSTGNYDGTSYFPAMKGLFNFAAAREYPVPAYTWTNVTGNGPAPSPRAQAAETYDAADGYVLLFGGHNSLNQFSDTWTYQHGIWTKIKTTGSPSARRGAAITYDSSCACAILFGGSTTTKYHSDTWEYKAGVWTNITTLVGTPAALRSSSLAYDAATGQLVLFGGHVGVGLDPKTYGFVNTTYVMPADLSSGWVLTTQTGASPAPRAEANMVYDPSLGEVVMFGGYNNSTTYGDTWLFNDNEWNLLSKKGPPPAGGAAVDYDAALGGVLIFGGNNNAIYLQDTWILEGKTWVSLWAWPGPSHRAVARGIYDPVDQDFVVFGGQRSELGGYLNETWTFT